MKKYLIILLLPLAIACKQEPKEAIISGTLQNYKDTVVYLSSKGITETVKLNADKTFEYKTTIDKPVLYTIKTGRKTNFELYLNPGDNTQVTIDFENLKEGPKFSGVLESVNKILQEKEVVVDKYITDYHETFILKKDEFNKKMDSLKNALVEKVQTISNSKIAELETERADYLVKSLEANYPEYHAYYSNIEFKPDSADYTFLEGFNLNNAYHLMYKEYLDVLNTTIINKFKKEIGNNNLESIPAPERLTKLFAFIDKSITSIEVRDYLKQVNFMDDLSYGEFWKLTELVDRYKAECQTVGYKNIIEKLYNQKMNLAPGKPAPLFKYKDINGKEYALENLKGKLVYIDFWATWCGPCRHELPYLEEVEKAYKGKKITFISMSLDDDMFAWDKMVKDKKMMGLQLHADGAFNSTVAKDYQIKGIPTFVLIDQNGIIISPSASRPSSGADLVNLLDESLAKIK
ncbi:MAG: TlpA family protein disulfide reductase [Bacteroidales bacterium]|nr:TlpA family protein disulfide reductase [Bacteroidales bacterium]